MKKITLLFLAFLAFSLTATAQFTFPTVVGPTNVAAGAPVTLNINDAANAASATAGSYSNFIVTADWVAGVGNPWSSEADVTVTTTAGSVVIDPATTGSADSGAMTTMTFVGDFTALYDPSVDGFLDIVLNQSFGGSDAPWTNIVVQILPPPLCGDATGVTATPVDTSSDFSWTAPVAGTPTGYNWEVQPDGIAQGTGGALASGTVAGTMVNSGVVLMASTPYEFYVQTDCGVDGTANYITIGFTTTAGPPPVNDECTGALPVACGDTVTGSTVNASDSGNNAAFDVFYSFTDTVLQDVTLSLCNSGYDTYVRVFDDCPQTNEIAGNDDSATCPAGTFTSEVTFTAQPNVTYYIMIEGFAGTVGAYQMDVSCITNVPAPANDLCANPVNLILDAAAISGTTAGATDNSTGATDDTVCEGFSFKSDVWYTFTTVDTDVSIVTAITGSSDQANVAVYSSVDCSQLDADSVACSNGNGGENVNVIGLTAATQYYVRVWSDGVALRPEIGGTENRVEGTFTIAINDATLSTPDFDNENAFTYFPNPTKNSLTLRAQNTIQDVTVYNILGQQVLRTSPNAIENDIDMSSLQAGSYFVQVTINNVTETVRIIKQ